MFLIFVGPDRRDKYDWFYLVIGLGALKENLMLPRHVHKIKYNYVYTRIDVHLAAAMACQDNVKCSILMSMSMQS
jgi:hypothetical protein